MNLSAILKAKGGEVVSVSASTTIKDIAAVITARKIGAVVVLAQEKSLAGIISERDVVRVVSEHGADGLALTAEQVMTQAVTTATPQTSVNTAMELMDSGYFRHLPVLEDGALVGIISIRDAVRAHIQDQANEVDSLKSYVFRGAQVGGLR